jgi:hypothetical protein
MIGILSVWFDVLSLSSFLCRVANFALRWCSTLSHSVPQASSMFRSTTSGDLLCLSHSQHVSDLGWWNFKLKFVLKVCRNVRPFTGISFRSSHSPTWRFHISGMQWLSRRYLCWDFEVYSNDTRTRRWGKKPYVIWKWSTYFDGAWLPRLFVANHYYCLQLAGLEVNAVDIYSRGPCLDTQPGIGYRETFRGFPQSLHETSGISILGQGHFLPNREHATVFLLSDVI